MKIHTLTLLTLTAALGACSAMPDRNSDLDRAQNQLQLAQRDAKVAQLAPEELKQASDTLHLAQKAWQANEPKSTVDHLAYMTSQRVVVAKKSASSRSSQAVIASASSERDRMRLDLRTAEVDKTRQQLASSEQSNARKTTELAQADTRVDALEQQLQALNAKKTERGYVVTMEDVLFDTGQARLMPEAAGFLARMAGAFEVNPTLRATIEGHTDNVGKSQANEDLSNRRAEAVKAALVSLGVPADQLSVRGFGQTSPIASNETAQGRQMNRRVEIVFGLPSQFLIFK